jgi:preprotein translocase subunit SecG
MPILVFLTVVQAIVAVALVGVILMQQSEGGGLGVGGSPSGLMSARGAANFLTRMTGILAGVFVLLSIVLAALATSTTSGRKIDTSLNRNVPASSAPVDPLAQPGVAPPAPAAIVPVAPAPVDPLNTPAKK